MAIGRILLAILGCVLVMAVLLGLRQERLARLHHMADLHARMDADRKQLWDLQVRIAERSRPQAIEEALERRGLKLEPIADPTHVPVAPSAPPDPEAGPGEPSALQPLAVNRP